MSKPNKKSELEFEIDTKITRISLFSDNEKTACVEMSENADYSVRCNGEKINMSLVAWIKVLEAMKSMDSQ